MISKKIILGLTGITAVAVPLVAVISCSSDDKEEKKEKKEVTTTNLNGKLFELTSDSKSIKLKDNATLPKEVEVKYYKGEKSEPKASDYGSAPTDLKDGEIVKIKFFIKSESSATYKFPESFMDTVSVQLESNDLKIFVDTSKLVKESFEVSNVKTKGKIGLKAGITLPEEVEVKYYKGTGASGDGYYASSISADLDNTDKVEIKFFIKSGNDQYKFPTTGFTNPIVYTVSGLKIAVLTTKLVGDSFEVTGSTSGSLSLGLKSDAALPGEVEVKYYKGEKSEPEASDYVGSYSDLADDDIVMIKFFVASASKTTHEFESGFKDVIKIKVKVSYPNKFKVLFDDTSKLVKESFEVTGSNGSGTIGLKSGITLPAAVEVKYYKGASPSNNAGDYQSSASSLSNGNNVQIKFFIASSKTSTHEFPSEFKEEISYEVQGLIN